MRFLDGWWLTVKEVLWCEMAGRSGRRSRVHLLSVVNTAEVDLELFLLIIQCTQKWEWTGFVVLIEFSGSRWVYLWLMATAKRRYIQKQVRDCGEFTHNNYHQHTWWCKNKFKWFLPNFSISIFVMYFGVWFIYEKCDYLFCLKPIQVSNRIVPKPKWNYMYNL